MSSGRSYGVKADVPISPLIGCIKTETPLVRQLTKTARNLNAIHIIILVFMCFESYDWKQQSLIYYKKP